jgi:hypothetical protein
VFARDNFTCQYCGAKAPAAPLQPDHIMPKSRGGSDDSTNLITACFDCNTGKRDQVLESPPVVASVASVLAPIIPKVPFLSRIADRVRRTNARERLARLRHHGDCPTAEDFVYIGPDEFIPQFRCVHCGMVNTYEGDSCGCATRIEGERQGIGRCRTCGERRQLERGLCESCDDRCQDCDAEDSVEDGLCTACHDARWCADCQHHSNIQDWCDNCDRELPEVVVA